MDTIIIDNIPLTIDEDGFLELLRIRTNSRQADEFVRLLTEARDIAKPKAAFRPSYIENSDKDSLTIEGILFSSRVLSINLEPSHVVFPFLATCGREIEEWARTIQNTLHSFWVDNIQLMAFGCAVSALESHLKRITGTTTFSSMNPGSLEDWPLSEQVPLFELLEDAPQEIGVTLEKNMLLAPLKSATGIQFVSEEGFTNCRLCHREDCAGRREPFQSHLLQEKYSL
ncbi:MAG: vitamin B12 dependent methionine synthase [Deltaproteobacteria bacterium]|nr:vitamin B12 dependent methionine synthase [Deltaproteobacteria bacterium]MBN2845718.1 vitamin B12 dependent methionine synthase [Deltaproteobacteria bacterium]